MKVEALNTTTSRSRFLSAASLPVMAELTKARLNSLVLLTTAAGFYLGAEEKLDGWGLARVLAGTGLLAGGAAVLNQYLEREFDARMTRTAHRPLPAGQVKPETALLLGGMLALGGLLYLAAEVNLLTAFLGAVTLITYLFIYTPLKRRTIWNTVVGAVPGALPPVMGWVAAQGRLDWGALAVFAILFFWQVPHFLAIAWMYRDDYRAGGYRVLPVVDPECRFTAFTTLLWSAALLPVTLAPALIMPRALSPLYVSIAFISGAVVIALAVRLVRKRTRKEARRVFFASIIHLPLLLLTMVVDALLLAV